MLKNPLQVNDMLLAMTSNHDIEWLAAQLMPRVKGVLSPKEANAPLRVITYAPYRVDEDGNVLITDDSASSSMEVCVYAVYRSDPSTTYELPLKVCQNMKVAERLARELRTLVYGRERLAGRMRSRDDPDV